MEIARDIVCVILAGGQGKRMGRGPVAKACVEILGRPAILRAIDAYRQAGLRRFLVVIGQQGRQVKRVVSAEFPATAFARQARPRGTGDAAAVAVRALERTGGCPAVLVTMGDKLASPDVVRQLIERFRATRADLAMATLPKSAGPTAGRVLLDPGGAVLGVVEVPDIDKARRTGGKVRLAGRRFGAAQVERLSPEVNPSLYLFRFDGLREAVGRLRDDNAQGELYLTDAVEHIAAAGRIETVPLADPADLMAFNNQAELGVVERALADRQRPPRVTEAPGGRLSARILKPAARWLQLIEGDSAAWRRASRRVYGADAALLGERRRTAARVVRAFVRAHGPQRKMILCRAPGRVNLMGRHVDHRGGFVNVMTFGREVLLAAARREDGVVRLAHVHPRAFPARRFSILELLGRTGRLAWADFVDSPVVREVLSDSGGDWSHYARAAVFRLQHEVRGGPLSGMDCVAGGNIPMGAGLSSSSAMVVAFAEAAVALNGLDVSERDFVDLCGEAEWFVGSRGGSCDHAAIRTGRIGRLGRIGFFPFRLAGQAAMPPDLAIVIADSGDSAVKSAGARDVFNQRVACYELAELLLRRHWRPAASIEHFRDLTPEHVKRPPAEIWRALSRLPERPSRRALRKLLGPADRDRLDQVFATHANLGPYDLRGVAMYGLGEIARSERFADVLASGDLARLGRMIRTSHNGDRRVKFVPDGRGRRFLVRTDDAALERLAAVNADPADVCGRYACSTEGVDRLVDLAESVEGVVGAQLVGAGLGGCATILTRAAAAPKLLRHLRRAFYAPRGMEDRAFIAAPVAGAEVLSV